MQAVKYIALFALIQIVSAALFLPGVILCGSFTLAKAWTYVPNPTPLHPWNDPNLYHWSARWMWLFDNEEDGLSPIWYLKANATRSLALNIFMWTALRNYANNFRFVPGVSKVGRPLWVKAFMFRGKQYHIEAGWLSDGYPALNLGPGAW